LEGAGFAEDGVFQFRGGGFLAQHGTQRKRAKAGAERLDVATRTRFDIGSIKYENSLQLNST